MNLNLARRLWSNRASMNALLRLGCVRSYNRVQADTEWDRSLKEAEDAVGGHSFRNVEILLNNDMIELTGNFILTSQPLPDAPRRNLIKSNDVSLGLVVLLFAKAAQRKRLELENQLCPVTGVLHSQYIVSKVTELLKLSFKIHKQVYDAENLSRDLNHLNRITILSGDYILSECLRELAGLPDHFILDYMASAFRDLVVSRHLGITDERNGPLPSKPRRIDTAATFSYLDEFSCDPILFPNALGDASAEWLFRTTLGGGSLLAKSCLSCLRLADYPEYSQNIGFSFGKSFALVYQAYQDLNEFLAGSTGRFSLVSAPFLFQLQSDTELYKKIENVETVDFDFLRGAVMNGPGLEKTMLLQKEYLKSAIDVLDILGESRAQAALKNLVSFIAKRF